MLKIYLTGLLIFIFAIRLSAQQRDSDTSKELHEVTIKGYLSEQTVLSVPASVSVLTPAQLKLQSDISLVPALNTVPGVRMEERSPGSYRLSIRGSLLRSPFGVRNIKIYYDELPLTDAGGNTYLNAIDFNSVQGVEVLKGPDGSLFGANTGGVVLISPVDRYNNSNYTTVGINGGSFGLVHENAALQSVKGSNQLNINQAFETYHGYRQNSDMYRHYLQAADKWSYAAHNSIKILGFYSDLHYETPGGLTYNQYLADPQLARLPTKTIPGAIQQKIGIGTKMLFGGAVNEIHLTDQLRNVLAVYGGYVNFSNPFITNYEQRYEATYGLRTYFELIGRVKKVIDWKLNLGLEWEQTNADINNYGNRGGVRDTAQTLDKINTNQHFIFARYAANIYKRLHVEAAMSLNFYNYDFKNIYPIKEAAFTNRTFTPQLMPRLALSYQLTDDFIWRASVSRGYSTPATAEIRPTDNIINTSLQAEFGLNYETGFRLRNHDESVYLDVSAFYYKLQNAIVRRLNANETEYYVNAGGTSQPGFELYFSAWIIRQNQYNFVRGLQFNEAVSYENFSFSSYHDATTNYSGNQLTGVPQQVAVSSIQLKLPSQIFLFVQHNYTSRIPLNDGNTAYAGHYNLLQIKAGWQIWRKNKTSISVYAGADNLFDEHYSLGDDLNAVGNRYYNAAPPRNYFAGLNFKI